MQRIFVFIFLIGLQSLEALELHLGLHHGALISGQVMNQVHLQNTQGKWIEGNPQNTGVSGFVRQSLPWGALQWIYGSSWFQSPWEGSTLPLYEQRRLGLEYLIPLQEWTLASGHMAVEAALGYQYSTTLYSTEYLQKTLPKLLVFNPGTGLGHGMGLSLGGRWESGDWIQSLALRLNYSTAQFAPRALPYLGIKPQILHSETDLGLQWSLGYRLPWF